MNKIIVGGVPEHFNYPWKLAIDEGLFISKKIDLQWIDFPSGTGAMCEALREGEIDLAVILSEGIVKDIIDGNPSKIVQVYVSSPLLWGIHVAADSDYNSVEELKGTTAAISRFGSGSHLMAIVNAELNNWDLEHDLHFLPVEDLEGALTALPKKKGDYFMWEKFMTKPFVDEGIFRLIDEVPTPWPGFVIVARDEFIRKQPELLLQTLQIINSKTKDFKEIEQIDEKIAAHFDQQEGDVREWLSLTHWNHNQLSEEEIENIQQKLLKLDLIENVVPPKEIVYSFKKNL
ncbi:MAG TPA: substrate-binding domain-containing protein [Flavobacteriaceae bacterium]|nr:substrate-binding domain-containing protein [Flavobacteriaceae bacterium]